MSDFKNYLFEEFIKNHKRLKKLISLTGYCKQDDMYWGSSDNYEQYVSYEVWKYQQAKIDDLEKQLDMMKYINDEQSKNIQNAFKTIEIEQGFKDELQKRVDAALSICNTSSFPLITWIDRALRGGHETD